MISSIVSQMHAITNLLDGEHDINLNRLNAEFSKLIVLTGKSRRNHPSAAERSKLIDLLEAIEIKYVSLQLNSPLYKMFIESVDDILEVPDI